MARPSEVGGETIPTGPAGLPQGAAESHRRTSLPKGTWRKRDGQNWTHEFLHRSLHRTPGWTSFLGRRLFKHFSGVLECSCSCDLIFKKYIKNTVRELEGTTRGKLENEQNNNQTIIKQIKQQSYCCFIINTNQYDLGKHASSTWHRHWKPHDIVLGQGSKLGRAKQDLGTVLQTRIHQPVTSAIATTGL